MLSFLSPTFRRVAESILKICFVTSLQFAAVEEEEWEAGVFSWLFLFFLRDGDLVLFCVGQGAGCRQLLSSSSFYKSEIFNAINTIKCQWYFGCHRLKKILFCRRMILSIASLSQTGTLNGIVQATAGPPPSLTKKERLQGPPSDPKALGGSKFHLMPFV